MSSMKAKTCTMCGEEKPLSEFYKHPNTRDGRNSRCKICSQRASNESRRMKTSGVSPEEYARMLGERDGCCDICGTHERHLKRSLGVDLDHASGTVRGLLCVSCSLGLGNFKDDADRLLAAAKHLKEADDE